MSWQKKTKKATELVSTEPKLDLDASFANKIKSMNVSLQNDEILCE